MFKVRQTRARHKISIYYDIIQEYSIIVTGGLRTSKDAAVFDQDLNINLYSVSQATYQQPQQEKIEQGGGEQVQTLLGELF